MKLLLVLQQIDHILSPLTEGRGLKRPVATGADLRLVSPLTEGRGLKRAPVGGEHVIEPVAPHRGAWIETINGLCPSGSVLSPLTEGRGLKRGWSEVLPHLRRVAPHRGAWIETARSRRAIIGREVAPHRGAWIETRAL